MSKTVKLRRAARRCLLVLGALACAPTFAAAAFAAWAWWHAGHVREDRVDWLGGGRLVSVASTANGVDVFVMPVWPWPMAGQVVATSARDEDAEQPVFHFMMSTEAGTGRIPLGPPILSGTHHVWLAEPRQYVDPDDANRSLQVDAKNPPVRAVRAALAATEDDRTRWSDPLPATRVPAIPHALIVVVFLAPTLLCAGLTGVWLIARACLRRRSPDQGSHPPQVPVDAAAM
ncbi:MAG TPA: hypothetical protein VF796_10725 [Humisphaera sp.]